MHPYRAPARARAPGARTSTEDTATIALLALVGVTLLVAKLAAGGPADTGATFGVAFVALAIAGLIARSNR